MYPRAERVVLVCAAVAAAHAPAVGHAQARAPGELVLVDTAATADASTVVVRELTSARERVVATLPHVPGWGAEGRVSPDGRHLAVTVLAQGERPWQHASVYVVDLVAANAAPRRVLDEAVLTAPAWLDDETVAAVRAVGRHDPLAADARSGRRASFDYEVVALGPAATSTPRVILRDRCDALALIGRDARGELVAARTAWDAVALVALAPGAAGARTIADVGSALVESPHLTPDARAVVFAQIDAPGTGRWVVRTVDLDGASRALVREANDHVNPVPLARGVAYGSVDGHAVLWTDGARAAPRTLAQDGAARRLVVRVADAAGEAFAYERLGPGGTRVFVADAAGHAPIQVGDGQHWREAMGFRGSR